MIKETYYTRDYERWITPINEGKDTYCLVFGKTAIESRQRAQNLYKLMGLIDEPKDLKKEVMCSECGKMMSTINYMNHTCDEFLS